VLDSFESPIGGDPKTLGFWFPPSSIGDLLSVDPHASDLIESHLSRASDPPSESPNFKLFGKAPIHRVPSNFLLGNPIRICFYHFDFIRAFDPNHIGSRCPVCQLVSEKSFSLMWFPLPSKACLVGSPLYSQKAHRDPPQPLVSLLTFPLRSFFCRVVE